MQILIHIRFLFLFLSFRSLSLSLPLFIYHKAHTNLTHTAHSKINEHSMMYSFHLFAIYRVFIVFIVIVGILQTTARRRWIEMLCMAFFSSVFCFQFIIPVQRQIHHKQIYNLCVKNNNNNRCFDEMNSKKNKTLRHIHRNQTKPISFMCAIEGKLQLCVTKLCESSTYKLIFSPYFKPFFPQLGNFSAWFHSSRCFFNEMYVFKQNICF